MVYHFQISALVLAIYKFEKCVKYANEMIDDVIPLNSILYQVINRAILVNLQRRPLKLGRLIHVVLQEHTYSYKNSVPMATHSFPVPTHLISIC